MHYILRNNKTYVKLRFLGKSSGGFAAKFTNDAIAHKNMQVLRKAFGNSNSTLMLAQGKALVSTVTSGSASIKCDALITTQSDHNLIMRPADCPPIIILSDSPKTLALVHGSRTSLDGGVLSNAMQHLILLGVNPSNCRVYIGPGIASSSYTLPSSIMDELTDIAWRKHSIISGETIALDLAGYIYDQLLALGVQANHITKSRINTAVNNKYYSHYRATRFGKTNGRNGFACALFNE